MHSTVLPSMVVSLLLGGDVLSGPMVGDKLQEFKVQGFSGPQEGKEFEVLKEIKDGPTMIVFVHQITRPAFQLMKPLDAHAAKHEKLATHFIWLGEKEKMEAFLKRAKGSLNLSSPMSISLDGAEGPMAYGLNDRAALTILLAQNNKVVANFAFTDPNETNARPILKALAKLIGEEKK